MKQLFILLLTLNDVKLLQMWCYLSGRAFRKHPHPFRNHFCLTLSAIPRKQFNSSSKICTCRTWY